MKSPFFYKRVVLTDKCVDFGNKRAGMDGAPSPAFSNWYAGHSPSTPGR
jgi:hypothetical protein